MSQAPRATTARTTVPSKSEELLIASLKERKSAIVEELLVRNSSFFETEMIKLDSWGADVKSALEGEIKDLDREIGALRKEATVIGELERKIATHRKIKELERARHAKRKSLFEAQDAVDAKKDDLLSSTEARRKRHIERAEIFTIRWRFV